MKKYAVVDEKNCVACGTCVKQCPKNAIKIWRGCYAAVNENECVGCGRCAGVCPVGCIEIVRKEAE